MTITRIFSATFVGLEAAPVEVEVDVCKSDKSLFVIVGLPDTAVKESKDRVMTAVRNTGHSLLFKQCTINLAPGNLKKEGPLYDLPIALGVIMSLEERILPKNPDDYVVVGELGLNGDLRPINGALSISLMTREMGKKGLLLPTANAKEAAAIPDVAVYPIDNLKQALAFFRDEKKITPIKTSLSSELFHSVTPAFDFADIKGQEHVKRAMEIAAAGGHNIILSGPPGSGKTMLAKALLGIMPPLNLDEALEITKIHSVSGKLGADSSLVTSRPFRSPHHTVSYAGMIGGGSTPRPGEVSLAHNGVLFLDELPEFSRMVLEVLRQPLEDRQVTISRANGSFTFPTNFMCIAAMNPCPCGMLGHPDKACKDSEAKVARYRGKISGPLWDRIDMHIDVPALRYREMIEKEPGENSMQVQKRVIKARAIQQKRLGMSRTNAVMTREEMKNYTSLDPACKEVLRQAIDIKGISARATDRLIRVARTIADLEDNQQIQYHHMMEAIGFRTIQE